MPTSRFNQYATELKNSNGERYKCESCKSEVKAASPEISNDKTVNEEKNYTVNDVMKKLMEMDIKYMELFQKYEEQLVINTELTSEINLVKEKLYNEINKNEQNTIRNNIIISGIPSSDRNNVHKIVDKVKEALEITTTGSIKCYKIGQNEKNCVIKVITENETDKEKIMSGRKKRISSKDIGFEGDDKPIYFNHELTKRNHELFKAARLFKTENNYKYAWVNNNGQIFLRENEQSKIQLIQHHSDLKN